MDTCNGHLHAALHTQLTGLINSLVSIGSGDGLVPSGTKPSPEPILTKYFTHNWQVWLNHWSLMVQVMAWWHQATSHHLDAWRHQAITWTNEWEWFSLTAFLRTADIEVHIVHTSRVITAYTVGTPYNTAPYITGSNIARLGHGSQNSWSKLWIPVVKSAPVRVIFAWKSVPKKSIHGSSDIYLGTQWKQRHDSPWPNPLDVIVTFLWYDTIRTIGHRGHQSTTKKV